MRPKLAIICEASPTIGIGHITRCLYLASEIKNTRDWQVHFFIDNYLHNWIRKEIQILGFELHRRTDLISQIENRSSKFDLLFTDSLEDNVNLLNSARESGTSIFQLLNSSTQINQRDIFISPGLSPDWVDRNLLSVQNYYEGLDYLILPRQILEKMNFKSTIPKKIVVSLGGSNTSILIRKILEFLNKFSPGSKVFVFTDHPIQEADEIYQNLKIQFLEIKNEFLYEMSDCAGIICGSGTTIFQAIYSRKMFLNFLIADNQLSNFHYVKKNQLGFAITPNFMNVRDEQEAFLDFIMRLDKSNPPGIPELDFDLQGAERIINLMEATLSPSNRGSRPN